MFIVIERFDPEFPCIVTNEEGIPLIYDNVQDAVVEAEDCQDGLVVEI